MIIYIMVGPPCSGKTTLAKEILNYNDNIIRVNRDELRTMLKGKYVNGDYYVESLINILYKEFLRLACNSRRDILIDATHCKIKYINDIKKMLPENCNITIKYMVCSEPIWKLKIRNILRYFKTGVWIPNKVIVDMYNNSKAVESAINNNEI